MPGEATLVRSDDLFQLQLAASTSVGQVIQLPTGEAAFLDSTVAVSSGNYTEQLRKRGKAIIPKASGVVMLPGQRAFWDHSADVATYRKVNDKDFYLGIVTKDASSAQPSVEVDFNIPQKRDIDVARDFPKTVIVGTQGLNTMGVFRRGGGHKFILSSTSEAQKMDILSEDGFATAANAIIEFTFRVVSDGAGTNTDVNIGAASGTHATDHDSITQRIDIHLNGNAADIFAMSTDGSTTVAETDTTINYTEGSDVAQRIHCLIDMRNPADCQIYINGALVLDATTFDVSAGASTWFLLAHVEKTSSADVYEIDLEEFHCWFSEQ